MVSSVMEPKDVAKELYLNNFTYAQISAQLNVTPGVIRQWAFRGKWKQAKVVVPTDTTTGEPSKPIESQTLGDKFTARILNKSDQLLTALEAMSQPKRVKDIKECVQALSGLNATVRKALKLDEANGPGTRSLVTIFQTVQMPGAIQVPGVPGAPSDLLSQGGDQQVIDVQPVSEQAPGPESTPESTGPSGNA